jgi:hypothetical protein
MTNILGKTGQSLGLDGEERTTEAPAEGGAIQAGGAADTAGSSTGVGGGGTPDELAAGAAAAAGHRVAQATGGTDPIRPNQPDGSLAAGGQSTAGTDPVTPERKDGQTAPYSHDIGGGSGAV